MNTFETFENEVSNWVAEADSKFDQDIFNILSDMEAELETGEYTQEEVVDKVAGELSKQSGIEVSTEEGAQIEHKVEQFYSMLGLDSIPADRRSRDYSADRPARPTDNVPGVPGKVEGEPWIHSDDTFIDFLRWLVKLETDVGDPKFNANTIIDVVERPDKYQKEYSEFLDHEKRVDGDPYL